MRRWLRSLFARNSGSGSGGTITAERLGHMLAYFARTNIESLGRGGLGGLNGLGDSLSIQAHPRDIDFRKAHGSYRRDEIVHIPAHVGWSWHPTHARAMLLDGRVEYRFCTDGRAGSDCPITTHPDHIALIDRLFDIWYDHLGLPGTLDRQPEDRWGNVDRSDKMALIRRLLTEPDDAEFLFDILGGSDPDNLVLWIGWREEDDRIVSMCEAILQTGALSAAFEDMDLLMTWRGETVRVRYPQDYADRDTTITALNALIAPDYEIRFIRASKGGDTLAFLPLSRPAWHALEEELPDETGHAFQKIFADTQLFG